MEYELIGKAKLTGVSLNGKQEFEFG